MSATGPRAPHADSIESDGRARLRVVHPTTLRWNHVLPARTVVIGRMEAQGIDLPLGHGTVSRRHFELRWNEATRRHTGHDLDSHNGSRIDGEDIGRMTVALSDGAILGLGDVSLVYEQLGPGLVEAAPSGPQEPIVGQSPAIIALREAIGREAEHSTPVVLHGAAGTGKTHIAQHLHRRSRRSGPLVSVDCASSPARLESQLWGSVPGAFEGATRETPGLLRAADGGTLLLEEIGDLPLPLQPRLCRVLTEGRVQPMGSDQSFSVNARVIATSRANLRLRVDAGGFDPDLYAWLTQPQLRLPRLEQRRGDIMLWLDQLHAAWLDRHPEHPVETITLSAEAAETVLLHRWPGNLRDVERLVEELMTAPHIRRPIPRAQLPSWIRNRERPSAEGRVTADVGPPAEPPAPPTREEVVAAYRRFEGNLPAIARHLGRDRYQVQRWLKEYGLNILSGDGR